MPNEDCCLCCYWWSSHHPFLYFHLCFWLFETPSLLSYLQAHRSLSSKTPEGVKTIRLLDLMHLFLQEGSGTFGVLVCWCRNLLAVALLVFVLKWTEPEDCHCLIFPLNWYQNRFPWIAVQGLRFLFICCFTFFINQPFRICHRLKANGFFLQTPWWFGSSFLGLDFLFIWISWREVLLKTFWAVWFIFWIEWFLWF